MLDKITNYMQTISGSNTCNWDPVRLYIWVGKLMYKFNLFRELINILEYILTKYNFLLIDFDNMLLWLNLKSTKRMYGTNNTTIPGAVLMGGGIDVMKHLIGKLKMLMVVIF